MAIGTFGSFTQSRLAIYAAQAAITVAGNNVANINTDGYTRQKLDQSSLYIGGTDRYYSKNNLRIGAGVLVDGVSQIRDKYLDIRYRNEMATVGGQDQWLAGLEGIAQILDEVGDGKITAGEDFGVVSAYLDELYTAINSLTDQTNRSEYDGQVRTAADEVARMLKSYASRLESYYNDVKKDFDENLETVNGLLRDIRNLNETIRTSDIYGDKALELRDQRNEKLDKLSEYIKISAVYTTETIGPGKTIEKLIVKMGDANPDGMVSSDETVLIDGIYGSQISVIQDPVLNPEHDETKEKYAFTDQYNRPLYSDEIGEVKDLTDQDIVDLMTASKLTAPAGATHAVLDAEGRIIGFADNLTAENGDFDINNPPKYLTPEGKPTNNLEEAATVDNPNLNLSVSELRDGKGRILQYNTKLPEEAITKAEYDQVFADNGQYSVTETAEDGISTKITTYWRNLRVLQIREAYKTNPDGSIQTDNDGNPVHDYYYINLLDNNGNPIRLAEPTGDPPTSSYVDNEGNTITISAENFEAGRAPTYSYHKQSYLQTPSQKVDLDDNDIKGRIQSYREMLTEAGEFTPKSVITGVDEDGNPLPENQLLGCDENAGTKRGIPYYMKSLDLMANRFAAAFNNANQGYRTDPDGNLVTMTWDATVKNEDGTLGALVGVPTTIPYTNADGDPDTFTFSKSYMLNNTTWNMDAAKGGLPEEVQTAISDALIAEGKTPGTPLTSDDVKEYLSIEKPVYETDEDGNIVYEKNADGSDKLDANGDKIPVPIVDAYGEPVTTTNAFFVGGPMFSNHGSSDNTEGITASNISISLSWQAGPILIGSFICPPGKYEPASTDSDNLLENMTSIFYEKQQFFPDTLEDDASHQVMFEGTFKDFWINMGTVMGNDQKITGSDLDNHYEASLEIDTSRDSVSAVDFNDEAMNLFMYSQAYNAACRVLTTLDSVLDKLINGTGVTT